MRTDDLDYDLPADLIAQEPPPERSAARMLVLDRATGVLDDAGIEDLLTRLVPGDLLVLNDTQVLPARFLARRRSGARLEGLYLGTLAPELWLVMLRGVRRLKDGEDFDLLPADSGAPVSARFEGRDDQGRARIRVPGRPEAEPVLKHIGYAPLPPYIRRPDPARHAARDRERYQTVFAAYPGAVAAPTAGLHFSRNLLQRLDERGVETTRVTLHVGAGTFKPVTVERLEDHAIHRESLHVGAACVAAVNAAKAEGRRIIAVGTTATRALESTAVSESGTWRLAPQSGDTQLFITPGYRFRIIDGLLTNFHLPRSTLLALVGAFAGLDRVLAAYTHAVQHRYRFYSYGDAMLIL